MITLLAAYAYVTRVSELAGGNMETYLDLVPQAIIPTPPAKPFAQVLCYVVYGDNEMYYEGVKVSILSFFSQIAVQQRPLVAVLSPKPNFFADWQHQADLDFVHLDLSNSLMAQWVKDDYHYRTKTLGLAYIIRSLLGSHWVSASSKFLFFDSDTYFERSPLPLYEAITPKQVVMYKQEPKIFAHKKYRNYVNGLANQTIYYEHQGQQKTYQLPPNAQMYSSLIMGVMPHCLEQLIEISELMYPMRSLTNARTVEQFAFVEIMRQHYHVSTGEAYVKHYSRRRQKQFVQSQLAIFWQQVVHQPINQQIQAMKQLRFQRPWYLTLKQAIGRIFHPETIR